MLNAIAKSFMTETLFAIFSEQMILQYVTVEKQRPSSRFRHPVVRHDGTKVQLACQETPLPAKHVEEMIGHRPHAWDLRKVTADQKPHVALGQALSRQDLHEALIIGCIKAAKEVGTVEAIKAAIKGG
jgi:hypothetical protein